MSGLVVYGLVISLPFFRNHWRCIYNTVPGNGCQITGKFIVFSFFLTSMYWVKLGIWKILNW